MNHRHRTLPVGLLCLMLVCATVGCGGGGAANTKPETIDPSADLTSPQRAQLARSYLNAGRTREALEEIEAALEMDGANARMRYVAGQVYFQAGRFESSETQFLEALKIDPYLTDAHNFLGAIYNELGRPAEAEKSYLTALEDPAYPSQDRVYVNLGQLYSEQSRDEEALAQFRKAVEINPKNTRAQYEQAVILDKQGKLRQALNLYNVAEPAYRSQGPFHYRVGMLYWRMQRTEDSKESFRRCVDVAPGSESAAKCEEMLEILR